MLDKNWIVEGCKKIARHLYVNIALTALGRIRIEDHMSHFVNDNVSESKTGKPSGFRCRRNSVLIRLFARAVHTIREYVTCGTSGREQMFRKSQRALVPGMSLSIDENAVQILG
jgi:hypothetical protein